MNDLATGANAPLDTLTLHADISLPAGADIDATALQLYDNGKVRGDDDMCFYGQQSIASGAISLAQGGTAPRFSFDLGRVAADVQKIVLTATIDGTSSFGQLGDISVAFSTGQTMTVPGAGRSERAMILAELYRRQGAWKVRNVGQGFDGGLKAIAEHFGVSIADEPAPAPSRAEAPPTPPTPSPSVNLSKVSLTKTESRVSLEKADGRFGKIRINLNWNQKKKGGILGFGSKGVDLDLGAFIELKGNQRTIVQALGNMFGDYHQPPFITLLGDDRSGAASDGEWIEINGDQWANIERVLVYAFIYEGVANWQETDGVVRLLVPNQPEIEVRMNEYGSRLGMCAVAELRNQGGTIGVERKVEFFNGQQDMDEAYRWGFNWRAGRK